MTCLLRWADRTPLVALMLFAAGGCAEPHDITNSPAAQAARERAKTVAPGYMVRTVFSAYDAGQLMGLEGASFILRLPESAPPNNRPYHAVQWHVNGRPAGALHYEPAYIPQYVVKTRCWLIDIGVLSQARNAGTPRPVRWAVRFKGLDGSGWLKSQGPLKPPEGVGNDPKSLWVFHPVGGDRQIEAGQDILLGVGFVLSQQVRLTRNPLSPAQTASVAFAVYVRFQKDAPPEVPISAGHD